MASIYRILFNSTNLHPLFHDTYRSGKETKSRKAATEARAVPVDVVFWNAWERKCKNLVDMENDGYKHYVCIEPGIITDSCNVPAGQTLILQQNLAGSSLGDALDTKDSDSDDDPEASIRESDL